LIQVNAIYYVQKYYKWGRDKSMTVEAEIVKALKW